MTVTFRVPLSLFPGGGDLVTEMNVGLTVVNRTGKKIKFTTSHVSEPDAEGYVWVTGSFPDRITPMLKLRSPGGGGMRGMSIIRSRIDLARVTEALVERSLKLDTTAHRAPSIPVFFIDDGKVFSSPCIQHTSTNDTSSYDAAKDG